MRIIALSPLLVACGGGAEDDSGAQGPGSSITDPSFVTVGVYSKEGNDYVEQGQELVFEVGAVCATWERTAGAHDSYTTDHQHYNASDGNTYVDSTFSWTEYGPEHSQAEINGACPGADGVSKSVNWTDYFEEDHGPMGSFYLRIKSVE